MIEATDKDSHKDAHKDLHKESQAESTVSNDSVKSMATESIFQRLISSPYVHLSLLLLIVALCFGRTLTSYFLADDFGEVSYVSRIFNGEPQLFWSNFTGNYMQIPGMNVYRPWLLVSLVMDFLLYKANATGYYFTNLSYFTGVVFLVYFVTRQLTRGWSRTRSGAAAFFGAALFAANPLRCESVSWVVGRVDIICCFFYLSSYLLFLKGRASGVRKPQIFTVLGVLAFFLAMGTKEMAIGLPVLLALTAFFGIGDSGQVAEPDSVSAHSALPVVLPLTARLGDAAVFSAPLWVSAVIYFIIRYACLGTLGGGYVAGFGASQLSFMVQRWLDFDTIKRLFYPLSHSLFNGQSTIYSESLTLFYAALCGLALIRLVDKKLSLKWFLFLAGWLATAAVPIFQLWGLGFDLEGSRFYFFLSVPLCLLAPVLLFRPTQTARSRSGSSPDAELHNSADLFVAGGLNSPSALHNASELKILVASAVVLTGLGCVLGRIACLTDLEWVHAGKENKQVSAAAQRLAEARNKSELIPVLGIPKERNGAHQILNGSTFGTMLSPPFTTVNFAQRFATFDPIMFGPPEYIDATRFKSVLQSSHGEFFVWNSGHGNFDKLKADLTAVPVGTVDLPIAGGVTGWLPNAHGRAIYKLANGAVEITSLQEGDGVRIAGLNVNPTSADFLQFEYQATGVPPGARFQVFSTGVRGDDNVGNAGEAVAELAMQNCDSFETVRVPLSRYWRWFCQGNLESITVQPYPCSHISMRNFKLLSSNTVSPLMKFVGGTCDGAGIYRTDSSNAAVSLDRREVKGATGFEVEVGKVNYFFNNFEKVEGASPVQMSATTDLSSPEIRFNANDFPTPGFYELRARCIDAAVKPVGEYSDTLTLRITEPLKSQPNANAKN